MNSVSLSLPLPPTINHYFGQSGKRRFIKKAGVLFRELVYIECMNKRIEGRIKIHIDLWFPDKRRVDIDNRIKSALDAMQDAGLFENDEQIDDLRIVRRGVDKEDPRAEVYLATMEEE